MKTMQLIYLYTTKLYQSCCQVQSPFTVCFATEIEMKENSRLISETPWQAAVLLSKDVAEKLWSFVKIYEYENRSRYLGRYVILYSVTLTTSFYTIFSLEVFFWNFGRKVEKLAYSFQKIGIVVPILI